MEWIANAYACSQIKETEQNTHQEARNMDEEQTRGTIIRVFLFFPPIPECIWTMKGITQVMWVLVEVDQTRESTLHYRGAAHAKVPGRGRYKYHFHVSQNHDDPGRGNTTRSPPTAEGQPVERNRTTDIARQLDTGRSQGDKISAWLNPAPVEYTRWVVLSLVRYVV